MKKNFVFVVILLFMYTSALLANPISEIPRSKAKTDLQASLEKDYAPSYSTVEMLLNKGMEDYDKLCAVPDSPINNSILKDLMNDYYPSFSTILMLFEHNKESYERLNK